MTKEKFNKYDKLETYCETCKRMLPTKYFSYSFIKQNFIP